jgi:WD40 repeat protein
VKRAASLCAVLFLLAACDNATSGSPAPDYSHEHLVWTSPVLSASMAVSGAAFLPHSATLAVGVGDVSLWDVAHHRLIARLPCDGPTDGSAHVTALAVSPDGRTLAESGVCDQNSDRGFSLQLWNLVNGQLISTLPDADTAYLGLAFTPDGRTLVGGGDSGNGVDSPVSGIVDFWNMSDLRAPDDVTDQFVNVEDVAISLDGRTMVANISNGDGPQDYAVEVWDPARHRAVGTLVNHETSSLAYSPDGKLLATGDLHDVLQLWDMTGRRVVRTMVNPQAIPIMGLAFSPDGQVVAAGDTEGGVAIWDLASGRLISKLSCSCGYMDPIAFSPDGTLLAAAGGGDSRLHVWSR